MQKLMKLKGEILMRVSDEELQKFIDWHEHDVTIEGLIGKELKEFRAKLEKYQGQFEDSEVKEMMRVSDTYIDNVIKYGFKNGSLFSENDIQNMARDLKEYRTRMQALKEIS